MIRLFKSIKFITNVICLLVLFSGTALAILGAYELILPIYHLNKADQHKVPALLATGLLRGVDFFLMAIVFFVLAIGIQTLFSTDDKPLPIRLPGWLLINNFVQLKVVLWEAILTTFVVATLADLVEKKIYGIAIDQSSLIVPGIILIIALSLFFMKKGEHESPPTKTGPADHD